MSYNCEWAAQQGNSAGSTGVHVLMGTGRRNAVLEQYRERGQKEGQGVM